tara:strand:- start:568 stop:825 length:258 start_codon:yes stop_codon:yes gene_type:complete
MKLSNFFAVLFFMVGLGVSIQPLQAQPNLDDMFLNEDSDSFDPGLPIGTDFPSIRAIYRGQEINDVQSFYEEKGLVVFAIRSVDW